MKRRAKTGSHPTDGRVRIAALSSVEQAMAGSLRLSNEVVGIIAQAIRDATDAPSFEEALEIGYRAFGSVSCTEAAREGIFAFTEKRTPHFRR